MLHDVLLQSRLWGNNPYIYIYRVFQSWDASLMFSKHKVGNKIQDLMFTNFRLVIQNKRFLQPWGHQMGSPKWDFDVGSFVVVPNMGLHQKKLPKSGWMGTLVSVKHCALAPVLSSKPSLPGGKTCDGTCQFYFHPAVMGPYAQNLGWRIWNMHKHVYPVDRNNIDIHINNRTHIFTSSLWIFPPTFLQVYPFET